MFRCIHRGSRWVLAAADAFSSLHAASVLVGGPWKPVLAVHNSCAQVRIRVHPSGYMQLVERLSLPRVRLFVYVTPRLKPGGRPHLALDVRADRDQRNCHYGHPSDARLA